MLVRARICLVVAAVACAIGAAPALGAAKISGSDGDVWNATTTPTYTITGSARGVEIKWSFRGGDSDEPDDLNNTGHSPLTITLPGLSDGKDYRLVANETRITTTTRPGAASRWTPPRRGCRSIRPRRGPCTHRASRSRPTTGATRAPARAPSPDGGLVPTATPGPQSFLVTTADAAGNVVTARSDYTVGAPAPLPLKPAPLEPAPLVPTAPPVVAPATAGKGVKLPLPDDARHMRPRLGATVGSTQPLLRWRKFKGATLYNVQVFRLTGKRLVKVLSIFPTHNYVRVPAGRLVRGASMCGACGPWCTGATRRSPSASATSRSREESQPRRFSTEAGLIHRRANPPRRSRCL